MFIQRRLAKTRYIIITISPFITISIILPTVLGLLGLLNTLMISLILLNSVGSGIDILALILIFIQVLSGAKITSNGMSTYWKNCYPYIT
ncbi:MAG: metalloprotease family protein [Actinomycetota bacterium]